MGLFKPVAATAPPAFPARRRIGRAAAPGNALGPQAAHAGARRDTCCHLSAPWLATLRVRCGSIDRRLLVVGALVCAVAAIASWLLALAPRSKWNVLLITLDTTRADHLGCYGHSAARTPALDSLAEDGVLFERAYTVAPLTLPVHTTLFTGLYPAETGIVTNGRGRLGDDVPTLAELLSAAGYDTAAFVGSFVLNRRFGLDRGFTKYDDAVDDDPGTDLLHRQRDGESVMNSALKWLGMRHFRPFFCWIHLYDAHTPYRSHADLFGDVFAGRPYDAEIAYVDRQVGRAVEHLTAARQMEQTIVIVVGDHGEGLGEHGESTHSFMLYDTTIRIPMIVRHPGLRSSARRVGAEVSLVDMLPTIVDLLALPARQGMGRRSFAAGLRGGDVRPSPCYAATDDPFFFDGWSPLRTIRSGGWKYIRTARPELYNLVADPSESSNLAGAEPERMAEMEAAMLELENQLTKRTPSQAHLTTSERRAIESLGYVAAGPSRTAGHVTPQMPDVKDMMSFEGRFLDAVRQLNAGSVEIAIQGLRDLVRQAPRFRSASLRLAGALAARSEMDEAATVLRNLVLADPEFGEGHYRLGAHLVQLQRHGEAVAALSRAVELEPDHAAARVQLAHALLSAAEARDALHHANVALQLNRRDASAYRIRAAILQKMGNAREAVADCRKALQYATREDAQAHLDLGLALATVGLGDEALQHMERAVELRPRDADVCFALGAFLAANGRLQDAQRAFAKTLQIDPSHAGAAARLGEVQQLLRGSH